MRARQVDFQRVIKKGKRVVAEKRHKWSPPPMDPSPSNERKPKRMKSDPNDDLYSFNDLDLGDSLEYDEKGKHKGKGKEKKEKEKEKEKPKEKEKEKPKDGHH